MAIFKAVKSPSKKTGSSKGILEYVGKKAEKTLGINCSDDYKQAYKEFEETKEQLIKKLEGSTNIMFYLLKKNLQIKKEFWSYQKNFQKKHLKIMKFF